MRNIIGNLIFWMLVSCPCFGGEIKFSEEDNVKIQQNIANIRLQSESMYNDNMELIKQLNNHIERTRKLNDSLFKKNTIRIQQPK